MNPQIIIHAVFFFALGACIGSFLNVVIWRLPHRGREVVYQGKTGKLTLSWPPSHCPICDTPIRWYQNVPIVAWFVLKGRCAKCASPISIRYPLVELATGVLFLGLFLAYFVAGSITQGESNVANYALLIVHLVLIATLIAASAIDADWYIIPLSLPAFLAVVGVLVAPVLDHPAVPVLAPTSAWALPAIGATIGLLIANVLVVLKIIPQSFSNLPPAEPKKADAKKAEAKKEEEQLAPLPKLTRKGPSLAAIATLVVLVIAAWVGMSLKAAAFVMLVGGIVMFLIAVLPRDADTKDVTDEVVEEISTPHARREILKEVLFLALPIGGATLAYYLPVHLPNVDWLGRLLGALLGLLVGGGIVWFVRIFGTLLFGKEAMGLGDVHLMAGVGAIVGPVLVTFAFFFAPFLGIVWAIVLLVRRKPNVLPYGPWLSIASILSLLIAWPVIGWYRAVLIGQ